MAVVGLQERSQLARLLIILIRSSRPLPMFNEAQPLYMSRFMWHGPAYFCSLILSTVTVSREPKSSKSPKLELARPDHVKIRGLMMYLSVRWKRGWGLSSLRVPWCTCDSVSLLPPRFFQVSFFPYNFSFLARTRSLFIRPLNDGASSLGRVPFNVYVFRSIARMVKRSSPTETRTYHQFIN